MNLRERVQRDHDVIAAAEETARQEHLDAIAAKRARMADCTGTNTAVPHTKRSC